MKNVASRKIDRSPILPNENRRFVMSALQDRRIGGFYNERFIKQACQFIHLIARVTVQAIPVVRYYSKKAGLYYYLCYRIWRDWFQFQTVHKHNIHCYYYFLPRLRLRLRLRNFRLRCFFLCLSRLFLLRSRLS